MTEEQDARIALMEHFRFYLQYWGTIILALAAAFLTIVQLRSSLASLGFVVLLLSLILGQAGYAVIMTVVHGELCKQAVTKSRVQPTTNRADPYLIWLHKAILNDLDSEWHGWGRRLHKIGTWTGWAVTTSVSSGVAFSASAWFDYYWRQWPFLLVPFVAIEVAIMIGSRRQSGSDE